jgi:hypothetical protein
VRPDVVDDPVGEVVKTDGDDEEEAEDDAGADLHGVSLRP